MNRLLLRQIKRSLGGLDKVPPEMMPLLDAISKSYDHSSEDRTLLERAMDISSEELYEANLQLRTEAEKQRQALAKLKQALSTLLSVDLGDGNHSLKAEDDIVAIGELIEQQSEKIKTFEAQQSLLINELEAANSELKDFAYIVSHDLKAPLRGIGSLTDWLIQDYSELMDDDGKSHLKMLKGRVRRMHNLIEGILQYSRVGKVKDHIIKLDLNHLLEEVIDSVVPTDKFTVLIEGELPIIYNDATRVKQIFMNLISNAVKYNDKEKGEVKIACQSIDEDNWQFCITDNGPGIDEKYHTKIFQIFQTLNARDKVESTGIGLTVVKKIIEYNKGKIWLTSKNGEGTSFYFTLPTTIKVAETV